MLIHKYIFIYINIYLIKYIFNIKYIFYKYIFKYKFKYPRSLFLHNDIFYIPKKRRYCISEERCLKNNIKLAIEKLKTSIKFSLI